MAGRPKQQFNRFCWIQGGWWTPGRYE